MIRVLTGDCRDVLKTLPDASVQCCVTSPPYFGLRDYGVAGQIGLEASPDAFVAEMVAVFREVRRVLRDDGVLFLNLGDSYVGAGYSNHRGTGGTSRQDGGKQAHIYVAGLKPKDLMMIPARVALALQADGWWLRSDIIWAKPNPMPESVTDRPTSAHEHVFLLTKNPRYFWDAEAVREAWADEREGASGTKSIAYSIGSGRQDTLGSETKRGLGVAPGVSGRNCRNVWTIATQPFSEAHFATFPPALAERCIKAGTSERGCCSACGAPWVREMVTTRASSWEDRKAAGHEGGRGGSVKLQKAYGATHDFDNHAGGFGSPKVQQTKGWLPSCKCDARVVPCTVLDPFGGAGTTGLVADRLGRDAILIELNPQYADLARDRVVRDGPLFADVR